MYFNVSNINQTFFDGYSFFSTNIAKKKFYIIIEFLITRFIDIINISYTIVIGSTQYYITWWN